MAECQGAEAEGGFGQEFPATGNRVKPAAMIPIHRRVPLSINVNEFVETK